MPTSLDHVDSNTPMGANLLRGGATFKVWAPEALEVHVLGRFNRWQQSDATKLVNTGAGYWAGFVPGVSEWDEYKFFVMGRGGQGYKRDPYAREVAPSPLVGRENCVITSGAYPWHDAGFKTPAFNDLIVYQLDVGTFFAPEWPQRAGTFLDVVRKLDHLADLGVNCLELRSVIDPRPTFSPEYSGTDLYRPSPAFSVRVDQLGPYVGDVNRLLLKHGQTALSPIFLRGAANQLRALIDLCHLHGIAVTLTVAYDHAGAAFDDESLHFMDRQWAGDATRSAYFAPRPSSGGGLLFAFDRPEVRQFLIDNAKFFLSEFHVDGFHYERTNVITGEFGEIGWRFCQDLTSTVRSVKPDAIQTADHFPINPWVVKPLAEQGAGFDCCDHRDLQDGLRRAIVQASDPRAEKVDMNGVASALRAPELPQAWQALQSLENADRVYRGRELRIPALADPSNARSWYARSRARVALATLLCSPGIPLIFQGQELLEDKQWAREIERFPELLTYWDGLRREKHMNDFHHFVRDVVQLRRRLPALRGEGCRIVHVSDAERVLVFQRFGAGEHQQALVVATLSEATFDRYAVGFPSGGRWLEVFNSDVYEHWPNPAVQGNGGSVLATGAPLQGQAQSAILTLPANCVLVFTPA